MPSNKTKLLCVIWRLPRSDKKEKINKKPHKKYDDQSFECD